MPEVRNRIRETVVRIRSWGFELIKHDFSTLDFAQSINRATQDGKAIW